MKNQYVSIVLANSLPVSNIVGWNVIPEGRLRKKPIGQGRTFQLDLQPFPLIVP